MTTKSKKGYRFPEQHYQPPWGIDIYRTLHLTSAEYTFFSSAHGPFTKIGHMLGQTQILINFKMWNSLEYVFQQKQN